MQEPQRSLIFRALSSTGQMIAQAFAQIARSTRIMLSILAKEDIDPGRVR